MTATTGNTVTKKEDQLKIKDYLLLVIIAVVLSLSFSVVLNNLDNKLRTPIFEINNQYSYYSQSPLARTFNIWQPPKLG